MVISLFDNACDDHIGFDTFESALSTVEEDAIPRKLKPEIIAYNRNSLDVEGVELGNGIMIPEFPIISAASPTKERDIHLIFC